jgi:hypothetical protein
MQTQIKRDNPFGGSGNSAQSFKKKKDLPKVDKALAAAKEAVAKAKVERKPARTGCGCW